MNITAPTIHLNGSSAKTLFAEYQEAYDAVRDAIIKFSAIEFHSRDYYVQDSGTWTKALEHRIEQREAMGKVEEYLFEHLIAIQNQEK